MATREAILRLAIGTRGLGYCKTNNVVIQNGLGAQSVSSI